MFKYSKAVSLNYSSPTVLYDEETYFQGSFGQEPIFTKQHKAKEYLTD